MVVDVRGCQSSLYAAYLLGVLLSGNVHGNPWESTKKAHGVQGVECSNHSVPTNKIKGLDRYGLAPFYLSGIFAPLFAPPNFVLFFLVFPAVLLPVFSWL